MSQHSTGGQWRAVRDDVVALVREVDTLKTDLAKCRDKAAKGQRQFLLDALDVLDNFDRVFANIEPRMPAVDRQTRIWVGNFRAVRRVLVDHLKKHGVVGIEAPDGKAVPGIHIVTDTRGQLDLEDGTILEEVEKGYLWSGGVLRKAKVIVVKN